jgi:taurine dioxygenase
MGLDSFEKRRAMPMTAFSIKRFPVGAEIGGLSLDSVRDPDVQAALHAAWLEHAVLAFKNVDSYEMHIALSRCFGEPEPHPVVESRCKDEPLFVEIGGSRSYAYIYDDTELRANRVPWHRDTAYTSDVCTGAMLRLLEVPAVEGDTWFADTAKAYDDLPSDVKARLEGMEYKVTWNAGSFLQDCAGIWWKTVRRPTPEEYSGPIRTVVGPATTKFASVILPALLTHPESGRKCLYLSPTYIDYFLGMEQAESDAFLHYLTDHMTQDKYVYRHKWSVNDAVIWDNRRLMHAAEGHLPDEPRRGLRTTIAGSYRIGRFFDPNAKNELPVVVD